MATEYVEFDTGSSYDPICLRNSDRQPIDLTGKTVWLDFTCENRATKTKQMTIVKPLEGKVTYQFSVNELRAGLMKLVVRIVDSTGKTITNLDPVYLPVNPV